MMIAGFYKIRYLIIDENSVSAEYSLQNDWSSSVLVSNKLGTSEMSYISM